jgi:hypothetical protein
MKKIWQWVKKHRIGIGIGVGVVIFLLPFCCLAFHDWFGWGSKELYTFGLELKDFMTVWIALGGVVAVVGGIVQTQRRINLQEKQLERQDKQFNTQQRDGRFASGVELLGNPHESTRIGGAYNLYFLARDFEELRPAVCEILCAHLRTIAHKSKFETEEQLAKYPKNEVQSIIDLLFRKHETDESGEEVPIFHKENKSLDEVLLWNVYIGGLEGRDSHILNRVHFARATLIEVRFPNGLLTSVKFYGTILINVNFDEATLTDVDFFSATLTAVHFSGVTLAKVRFTYRTTLTAVSFLAATLTDVAFWDVTLTKVEFFKATLTKVQFWRAELTEVDFSFANLTEGTVDFKGTSLARYSYKKITHPGFSLKKTSPKAAEPPE